MSRLFCYVSSGLTGALHTINQSTMCNGPILNNCVLADGDQLRTRDGAPEYLRGLSLQVILHHINNCSGTGKRNTRAAIIRIIVHIIGLIIRAKVDLRDDYM